MLVPRAQVTFFKDHFTVQKVEKPKPHAHVRRTGVATFSEASEATEADKMLVKVTCRVRVRVRIRVRIRVGVGECDARS